MFVWTVLLPRPPFKTCFANVWLRGCNLWSVPVLNHDLLSNANDLKEMREIKCLVDSSWLCAQTVHVRLYWFLVVQSCVWWQDLHENVCVCERKSASYLCLVLHLCLTPPPQSHSSSCHQSFLFFRRLLFLSFFGVNVNKPLITSCGTKLIEDDWFFPGCSDPALANRQRELEEELAQARGLHPQKGKKTGTSSPLNLQVRAAWLY